MYEITDVGLLTYTKLAETTGVCASCLFEDNIGQVGQVSASIGIVEPFSESIDEDTRIGVADIDGRVGSVFMVDGQELVRRDVSFSEISASFFFSSLIEVCEELADRALAVRMRARPMTRPLLKKRRQKRTATDTQIVT